jgi:hypothetical protein
MVRDEWSFLCVVSFLSHFVFLSFFFLFSCLSTLLLLGITKEVVSLHCVSSIVCILVWEMSFVSPSMSFLELYQCGLELCTPPEYLHLGLLALV